MSADNFVVIREKSDGFYWGMFSASSDYLWYPDEDFKYGPFSTKIDARINAEDELPIIEYGFYDDILPPIKRKKLEPGKRYVVTKGNDTLEKGDHIWLETNICCKEAGGWLSEEDAEEGMKGVEFELDMEWIARRKAQLEKELEKLG